MSVELALAGDNPDLQGLHEDVADMQSMLEGYMAFARGEAEEDLGIASLSYREQQIFDHAGEGLRKSDPAEAVDNDPLVRRVVASMPGGRPTMRWSATRSVRVSTSETLCEPASATHSLPRRGHSGSMMSI